MESATSLVVQTAFLGDVVLTTPLIAQLAQRGPVDVVVTPLALPLLANNPYVRRVIAFDKRGVHRGLAGLAAMSRAVQSDSSAATAYLAQGSLRTAMLATLARYRHRVGFATSPGRVFYTQRVPNVGPVHRSQRLWRLAFAGGIPPQPVPGQLRPRLYPGPADEAAALAVLGAAADEPLIALAPGSNWQTKRWPGYAALARQLQQWGRVVVLGGPDEAPLGQEISAATGGAAIDATGILPLLASAAVIARSRVIVANDSALLHVASAFETPTVGIFGPTTLDAGFGPLAPSHMVVQQEALECRPCSTHGPRRCPLGHWRCMQDSTVAQVVAAVELVVARQRAPGEGSSPAPRPSPLGF